MLSRYPFFLQAITLAALCLAILSCSRSEEEPTQKPPETTKVSIAVSRTPLSSPFYIAREQGYFAEEGLEVTFIDTLGGHKCLKKVLAGEAEMGTTSDTPIMFNGFKRDDFVVIATFVTSHNDVKIMARQDGSIQSAQDLAHKKIAVLPGSASQFFLDFFLLMNGVDHETVTIEDMNPEECRRRYMTSELTAYRSGSHLALKALAFWVTNSRSFLITKSIARPSTWSSNVILP